MVLQILRLAKALLRLLARPEGRALAVLVLLQLVAGTVFYTFTEGWRWIDSLYFCVVTLATVGYGDFRPATDLGKIFTIVYLFTGVGTLVSFVTLLAAQFRPVPRTEEEPGD